MQFHILGLGAIGSLLAHHLRKAVPSAHTITLIHKTATKAREASLRGGLQVENNGLVERVQGFKSEVFEGSSNDTSHHTPSLQAHFDSGSKESSMIESLFITTKAHQTIPAVRRLSHRISPNSTIVLLQNGMGIYEELVQKIFRNAEQRPHFILTSNTHGAFLKGVYDVVHAGVGNLEFGIVPDPHERDFEAGFKDETVERSERQGSINNITESPNDPYFSRYKSLRYTVAAMLLMEPLNASWKPISEVQTTMRRKVVVNSVINPITALMGCRNGDAFNTDASRRLTKRVCQEAAAVFAAQVKFETKDWLNDLIMQGVDPSDVGIERIPQGLTAQSLEAEVMRVAELTKGNISSMLSDVRRGNRTEIDFLNGYLLKLGSTYKVEMPATATLLNLMKMRSAIPLDQML